MWVETHEARQGLKALSVTQECKGVENRSEKEGGPKEERQRR